MNGKKQSYTILKMIFNQNQPFSIWSIKFFNGILVVKIETFWMHAIKQNKTFNGDTNSKECRMVHRNGFFFSHELLQTPSWILQKIASFLWKINNRIMKVHG